MESYYESKSHDIIWDQRQQDIKYLKQTINLEKVKQLYQGMFLDANKKKVIVRVFPPKHYDKIEKDDFDAVYVE